IDRTFLLLPLIGLLIILFWIHGKRSIVASYIVIQYIFLLISNAIDTKKIVFQLVLVLCGFVTFLISYGKNIASNAYETYLGFRLDFTRDYGVKFALYNDLIISRHILPYDFASFIFNFTFYIPREFWALKPQPYAVYFTNSAFGNFGGLETYGWGLTTSIFSEHISNLGWLGLISSPILIAYVLNKESKSNNPLFKLLSILISILLIALHPSAFMVLILLYLVLLIKGKKKIVFK